MVAVGEIMRVLVAVDSFKGSMSSMQAAEAIRAGIVRVCPGAEVLAVPVADGGEGTVEALVAATGGEFAEVVVTGPLGTPVNARFGLLPGDTAVLEMAAASGLTLVPEEKRNPMLTTTFGTGELIKAALDRGATIIVMGIGGSATNDGGTGMAKALGVRLLDASGKDLKPGAVDLGKLARIDMAGLDPRVRRVKIRVACDVQNPLCGPTGASTVYGPQKGATPEMVAHLDAGLAHLAGIIREQLGIDVAEIPGAGAAGGLGAGLIAFAGAELQSGVDLVLDTLDLDSMMRGVDLVITGEGQIDGQSAYGKVPAGVAARAAKQGLPVLAVTGGIGPGAESLYQLGVTAIIPIVNGPISKKEAMENAAALTTAAVDRAFRLLKMGSDLNKL